MCRSKLLLALFIYESHSKLSLALFIFAHACAYFMMCARACSWLRPFFVRRWVSGWRDGRRDGRFGQPGGRHREQQEEGQSCSSKCLASGPCAHSESLARAQACDWWRPS